MESFEMFFFGEGSDFVGLEGEGEAGERGDFEGKLGNWGCGVGFGVGG